MRRWKEIYARLSLAKKIRCFYLALVIPIVVFFLIFFLNYWSVSRRYAEMIDSIAVASEFNLDFKKDFDYETYLLIVGNKTAETSELSSILADARRVVAGLEEVTSSSENARRLKSVSTYLKNLEKYKGRIEENLRAGGRYEQNIEIWENDVQIVTALIQDTVFSYIFYEARDLQDSRAVYERHMISLFTFSVLFTVLMVVFVLVMSFVVPRSITRPVMELSRVTDAVAKGDLSVRANVQEGEELRLLGDSLNVMIRKINDLLLQVKEEQTRLRKAQFRVLQAQINPHFLYNTLDAIVWLAEAGDEKQVVHTVRSLSDFFRATLGQGKDIVSVGEELQHVKSYLEIQQVRYRDILHFSIDVPEELHACRIPKITLQPLVENALYHGIKYKRGPGTIRVEGRREGNDCLLIVSDDGAGMSRERLEEVRRKAKEPGDGKKDVYGLYNVNERIRVGFGERYGLTVESEEGKGTSVCILLPAEVPAVEGPAETPENLS